MGKKPYLRGMWEHSSFERSKAKKSRQLTDEEKQAGIQGQWQQESPAREYLEQVKCCRDTDCNESMMKEGFTALKTWNVGRISRDLQGQDESLRMGLRQDKRGVRLGSKGRGRKYEHCARDHASKYGPLAANHCALWRTRRSHNVVSVPKLQQVLSGRLRLVGHCWKNHKVVVRNLWRKV